MKKRLLWVWLLLLAMLLCSCDGSKEAPPSNSDPVENAPRRVELVADGKARYKIVIPEISGGDVSRAADTLKNKLKSLTGAFFSVTDDYTRDGKDVESTGEIIIGNCKRTQMQTALLSLTYRDYSVSVTNENILIAGYDEAKVTDAVYAFIQMLDETHIEKNGDQVILIWDADLRKDYTSYKLEGLSLEGIPFHQYRIVYPASGMTATAIGEYIKIAQEVLDCIGRRCGAVLKICPDTEAPQEYEILIGKTNRSESLDFYAGENGPKQLDYGVAIRNSKILIFGGGLYSLSSAANTFNGKLSGLSSPVLERFADTKATLANSPIPRAAGDYRFMTYNILFEEWASGELPAEVEIRKELVSYLLLNYSPDVAALQECFDRWNNQLPELLAEEYEYVCYKRNDSVSNRSPLIYKKSKLNLMDSGYVDLDQTLTNNRRVVTWAVFEDKATGKQFAVLGTHWHPTDEAEKLRQSRITAELAKKIREERRIPVIVMGDFNSVPGSGSYSTFKTVSGIEHVTGTNGVDHIFYTNDFTSVAQGYESENCARVASDHFPVWIDLKLKA